MKAFQRDRAHDDEAVGPQAVPARRQQRGQILSSAADENAVRIGEDAPACARGGGLGAGRTDYGEGVAGMQRVVGDAHAEAVAFDHRAAFGVALDAVYAEGRAQGGRFQTHGAASGPDVPERPPSREAQP